MNDPLIRALQELPTELPPRRDLWPGIAAQLEPRRRTRAAGTPLLALAASVALLAVGVWIGRNLPPPAGSVSGAPLATARQPASVTLAAAFMPDSRFLGERAALRRQAQARLAAMPPAARARMLASLQAIDRALEDIRSGLGRDPANALLQELLVNTYQDEMRVLTELQTAGTSGEET